MVSQEERIRIGKKAGITGMICNIFLCAAKYLIGTLSGSVSITADAINNLSDAAGSVVTLLGFKLSSKKADADHPYGYERFEYLAGLIVSALILMIGVDLIKTSVQKIFHPEPVAFSAPLVLVLLLSIAVKLWLAAFQVKLGKSIHSKTLIASGDDARNDVISTGAVLAAALLEHFAGLRIDGFIGLLVALFILWSGIGIAKDTISPLLGEAPDEELIMKIASLMKSHEEILGIHDLIVHDYGPGRRYASAHAEIDARADVLEMHEIIDDIERVAGKDLAVELTIHYDPIVTDDPVLNKTKELVLEYLHRELSEVKIHDFRMVKGVGHSNILFDIVVPEGSKYTKREEQLRLQESVNEVLNRESVAGPGCRLFSVITFDQEAFNHVGLSL